MSVESTSRAVITATRAHVSLKPDTALRVRLVSTWDTACGIADYTAHLRDALAAEGLDTEIEPVDRSLVNYMSKAELHEHFTAMAARLQGSDLVHIQHEFGFFGGQLGAAASIDVFAAFIRELRRRRIAVAVTFHTNPVFHEGASRLRQKAARAYLARLWQVKVARQFNADPRLRAIVHSKTSRLALVRSGFLARSVVVARHAAPQPHPDAGAARDVIRARLDIPAGATVVGLFGFMSRYKGYDTAVAALARLPKNFHLLLVGGPHPFSPESALEDVLALVQKRRRLAPRVHLAGYVAGDEIAAYQSAIDICIAPYRWGTDVSASGALMWALSSSSPVIASKIPAFMELNESYDCLCMVTPEASRELAFRIEELSRDPGRASRLVERAQRYCRENSWSNHARRCLDIYSTVRRRP
jgi:glycosyltransferase involved in cell wall biosynthesis